MQQLDYNLKFTQALQKLFDTGGKIRSDMFRDGVHLELTDKGGVEVVNTVTKEQYTFFLTRDLNNANWAHYD